MVERDESRGGAGAPLTAVVGVLAAVGLLLVLLAWAATIGPDEVVAGGREPSYETPSATPVDNADAGAGARDRDGQRHELLWLILTVTVSVLAGVLLLALLLSGVRWLLTRNWRRRRLERDPEEIPFETLGAPALAQAVAAGASRQVRLLDEGSPRNAIVACWHQFEEQAASVGVRRAPWETSSEFTLRVLDLLAVDASAVTELAELYRDARHSQHDVTEESRARARTALDRIHQSLGAWSVSP